ncbi:MAG TPA: FAD-binding oxidoreductase [Streptosporangiaceae bacterium]|jgi:glycolate oxidase FAD binding subunit
MAGRLIPPELTAACARVSPAGPAGPDGGGTARAAYVAWPASVAEASAVISAAAGLGLTVLPRGTGTRLAWGAPPRGCDLIVETTGLNAVLEHAAGDLVARVQAGVRLADLAATLAGAGQRLALDPPGGATIGGLIATGVAGPLRLRYGTPRDLLIGITVIRADGVVTRSGGKVVKNVAGYDLGKLYTGSYGTLGLIAEATFRLHPRPAAVSFVTLDCAGPAAAQQALAQAAGSALAPVAAEIDRPARDAQVRAGILLEGEPGSVAERASGLASLLGGGAAVSAEQPPWWGRGAASAAGTVLRIAFWPGQLAAVLGAIDAAALAAGLDPAVSGSAAAGVIHAAVPASAAPAAVAGFVTGLRAGLPGGPDDPSGSAASTDDGLDGASPDDAGPPARASAVVLHAPAEVISAVDIWGPVPSLPLMRSVKDQFDPGHRMAPGRFAGGI